MLKHFLFWYYQTFCATVFRSLSDVCSVYAISVTCFAENDVSRCTYLNKMVFDLGTLIILQINEVLRLLNELLPTIPAEGDSQQKSEKEAFLINHPDILHKFGVDLLPILIQVGIYCL